MEFDMHLVKTLLDERKYQDAINSGMSLLKEQIPEDEQSWIRAYIGTAYFRLGQYDESVSTLSTLLSESKNSEKLDLIAYSHYWLGRALIKTQQTTQAIDHYHTCLKVAKKIDAGDLVLTAANSIAIVLLGKANLDEALHILQTSVKSYPNGNKFYLSLCYNTMGSIYRTLGENKKAIESYERSKALSENDPIGISTALNNIANVYLQMGEIDRAYEFYEQSKEVSLKIDDYEGVAFALRNMAELDTERGNFDDAEGMYQRSIDFFEKANQAPIEPLIGLAELKVKLEDFDAIERILTELEKHRPLIDSNLHIKIRMNIINAEKHMIVYEFEKSAKIVEQALALEQVKNLVVEYLYLLTLSAELAIKRNEYRKAVQALTYAYTVAQEKQLYSVSWNTNRILAALDFIDGRLDDAKNRVDLMIEDAEKRGFEELANEGRLLLDRIQKSQLALSGYEQVDLTPEDLSRFEVSWEEIEGYIEAIKATISGTRSR